MIKQSTKILESLQYPSGLFAASSPTVGTGYDKAWIRDCIYESLGLESVDNIKAVKKAYTALLDLLVKHEHKLDHAIESKPEHRFQYIHARCHPHTLEEIDEPWGNKQNDAVGALLFKIGDLEAKGIELLTKPEYVRVVEKLIGYLASIEYWHDEDNGMWEENEEVHASSVGACVAGLLKIRKIVDVPQYLIDKGVATLDALLPRESVTKITDLALLSLIYPYNVVSDEQAKKILHNVEHHLVRKKGVLRYLDDQYYSNGSEAEWTMGFAWLAIIFKKMGRPDKYAYYMRKTLEVMNAKGEMPELYFGGTDEYNENTPLGWAQAMYLIAARME